MACSGKLFGMSNQKEPMADNQAGATGALSAQACMTLARQVLGERGLGEVMQLADRSAGGEIQTRMLQDALNAHRGAVDLSFGPNMPPELRFLLLHWEFAENQFKGYFTLCEGPENALSKARFCLKEMVRSLDRGIALDLRASTHPGIAMPDERFVGGGRLLELVRNLYRLWQGDVTPYYAFINRVLGADAPPPICKEKSDCKGAKL